MKKKILSLGAVIAICLGVWTYSVNNVELSTLALANVEALTGGESGSNDEEDTGCKKCTSVNGHPGIEFYCKKGSGGCVTTECGTGDCAGVT